MFTTAFLEESGNGRLGREETLLQECLVERGLPIQLFTPKRIQRRQLPLSASTFIAGGMDSMHGAMQQLKIEIPPPNDYPVSLQPFMRRRTWPSTLGSVERSILDEDHAPVFAKPADRRKSFTGRTFASIDDFRVIGDVSRRQTVWCSDVVEWVSEFRVYTIGHEIGHVSLYGGDAAVALDLGTVRAALATFQASGEAPAAYGIDFGVLSTGDTALIEFNDGYSLGAYDVPATVYTDLLLTRWKELVSTLHPKP